MKFFQFLPLESEIHGVFKPVARKIIQHMKQIDCIPVVKCDSMSLEVDPLDVGWTKPSQVLLGDSLLRKIISPTDLKRYVDLSYISDVMQQNVNPALLRALGVHTESLDILLEIGISHIKKLTALTGRVVTMYVINSKSFNCLRHRIIMVDQFAGWSVCDKSSKPFILVRDAMHHGTSNHGFGRVALICM